jgi:hypothetical protein
MNPQRAIHLPREIPDESDHNQEIFAAAGAGAAAADRRDGPGSEAER